PTCLLFFNHTPTTQTYTLSLHDALPISSPDCAERRLRGRGGRWTHPGVEGGKLRLQRGNERIRRHGEDGRHRSGKGHTPGAAKCSFGLRANAYNRSTSGGD